MKKKTEHTSKKNTADENILNENDLRALIMLVHVARTSAAFRGNNLAYIKYDSLHAKLKKVERLFWELEI